MLRVKFYLFADLSVAKEAVKISNFSSKMSNFGPKF